MSAERATKQSESTGADKPRNTAEDLVEQWATYWGRAAVAAWRSVFPPRGDKQ